MLQTTAPIKFIKSEVKTGVSKQGKDYRIREAVLFVPDLGRVRVPVSGDSVPLPPEGSTVVVDLTVEQGSFQSMRVVWDENSKFKVM